MRPRNNVKWINVAALIFARALDSTGLHALRQGIAPTTPPFRQTETFLLFFLYLTLTFFCQRCEVLLEILYECDAEWRRIRVELDNVEHRPWPASHRERWCAAQAGEHDFFLNAGDFLKDADGWLVTTTTLVRAIPKSEVVIFPFFDSDKYAIRQDLIQKKYGF